MDITIWWEGLSTLQKIFWVVAAPSTVIFIIQLILLLVGGDHDMDADADGDFDGAHGDGVDVFSLKSIISFMMFFGWSGLAATESGMGMAGALVISFIAGLIMMFLTAWIFMLLLKLQHDGTMNINEAIGKLGEVYLTIPPKKSSYGKIQITFQGALRTMDALTEEPEAIKTGSVVEVIDVESEILIVKSKR